MDEREGRKARTTIADREHFTKVLGLHSSRPKGYEPAIHGQKKKNANSNKQKNVGLETFLQHHPSSCRPHSWPCRPLARQPYYPEPKSLEGPASAHRPGWARRWFPGSCPHSLEAPAPKPGDLLAAKDSPTLGLSFSASLWPASLRVMTAHTRTSPLSQDDPNAYFTSACCRAPFLPTFMSSCLPHPSLLPAPHPSQLLSFFFFCHTYHILVSIPRVALQARVPKSLCHFLIAPGTPLLPEGLCTCHFSSKLPHN